MEFNTEKLFAKMKTERLSAVEKARMRESLIMHMQGFKPSYREFRSERLSWASVFSARFVYVPLVAILLVFTGFSFAAEGSLPGSALYSLKLSVNEPLRAAVAFSPESKIRFDAQLAERRLDEVAELSSLQRLEPDVEDALMTSAVKHAEDFADKLNKFESRVNPEVAVSLSLKLESDLDSKVVSRRIAVPKPETFASSRAEPSLMMMTSPVESRGESEDTSAAPVFQAFSVTTTLSTSTEEEEISVAEKASEVEQDTERSKNSDTIRRSYENRAEESVKKISEIRERLQEKAKVRQEKRLERQLQKENQD